MTDQVAINDGFRNPALSGAKKIARPTRQSNIEKPCSFYIVSCRSHSYVKFGISQSLKRRLAALQSASPFELDIIGAFGLSNRLLALSFEERVFQEFDDRWLRGEWFYLPNTSLALSFCSELQKQEQFGGQK